MPFWNSCWMICKRRGSWRETEHFTLGRSLLLLCTVRDAFRLPCACGSTADVMVAAVMSNTHHRCDATGGAICCDAEPRAD